MRYPAPAAERRPPRALSWEFASFAGFSGLLVIAAVFVSFPPAPTVGTGVLLAFTAVQGWRATIPAACVLGAIAWPFYLGFVLHSDADLGIRGPADLVVLAALVTVGAAAAALRRHLRTGAPHRPRSAFVLRSLGAPTDARPDGPGPT